MGQQPRDRRPWPYSVGTRGVNRVRVYTRSDSSLVQIEWWDDLGRQQKSLRSVVGEPILDTPAGRTLARDIADELSKAQGEKAMRAARAVVFGHSGDKTLKMLFDELHKHRESGWRPSYRRDQERFRVFWLEFLGENMPLTRVPTMPLEAMIAKEGETRGWAARTAQSYLRYLKDAFSFAQDRLKWIDERFNLSALQMPEPQSKGVAYSQDECVALLPKLWAVDPRAGLIGEAYYQAGRRLNGTRMLRLDDVRFETVETADDSLDVVVLTYRDRADKAKRTSEAVLEGEAVQLVRALMGRPLVASSGLLLPHGDLDRPGNAKPIRKETLNKMLHEAEEAAGIPHVKGRSYHGIKRRFAGMSADSRERASKQSGTTVHTLRKTYDPDDDLVAKAELAAELNRKRRGK